MNPKVSVVIATYNYAHFLPECLGSVKAQTYREYETIVVDNGSTDNTREVIKRLAWGNFTYHYQDNTGSVAGPRNTGLKLAKGDYVAFLDSDDLWYEDKLEKIMGVLAGHPEIDVISHDLVTTTSGVHGLIVKVGPKSEDLFRHLLLGNCVLGSATVAKRAVMLEIGGFDENKGFVHVEDYETWLKLAYLRKKFYFVNEVLGEYRIHKNNMSHDLKTAYENEFRVIKKYYKYYHSRYLLDKFFLYNKSVGKIYLRFSYRYFLHKKYLFGIMLAIRALLTNPLFITRFNLSLIKRFFAFERIK